MSSKEDLKESLKEGLHCYKFSMVYGKVLFFFFLEIILSFLILAVHKGLNSVKF